VTDVNINYDFPLRLRLGAAEPLAPLPGGGRAAVAGISRILSDF